MITRTPVLKGPTDSERQRLTEIADRCPVHRTLENQPVIRTALIPQGDYTPYSSKASSESEKHGVSQSPAVRLATLSPPPPSHTSNTASRAVDLGLICTQKAPCVAAISGSEAAGYTSPEVPTKYHICTAGSLFGGRPRLQRQRFTEPHDVRPLTPPQWGQSGGSASKASLFSLTPDPAHR